MKTIELLTSTQGGIILFSYFVFFGTFIHALITNHKRKKKNKISQPYRSLDHYIGVIIVSLVGFLPNEIIFENTEQIFNREILVLNNLVPLYFFLGTIIYFLYFSIKDDFTDFTGSILMFMLASYLTSINLALNSLLEENFYINPFVLLGLFFCLIINFVYLTFNRNNL